jgi:hypothetical protein
MKSVYNFIVKPIGDRYNNKKKVGDKELILNTEIFNHQYVNRLAEVISTPTVGKDLGIKPGDTVITHFNVFRRWHDVKGRERNSRSYFNKNTYLINHDQIFLYKRNKNWICPKGYCFVQPIKETDKFGVEIEKPITGLVKYSDGTVNVGEVIGYRPETECEFIIDNTKLYRILSNLITIKYEHQANQETYNPSWAQSS